MYKCEVAIGSPSKTNYISQFMLVLLVQMWILYGMYTNLELNENDHIGYSVKRTNSNIYFLHKTLEEKQCTKCIFGLIGLSLSLHTGL